MTRLDESFMHALAQANPAVLETLATPWSPIEEIGGMADPDGLASFLRELQALASGFRAPSRTGGDTVT